MLLELALFGAVRGAAKLADARSDEKHDLTIKFSRLKSKLGKARSRRPGNFREAPIRPESIALLQKGSERVEIKSDDEKFELSVSKVEDLGRRNWDTPDDKISRLNSFVSALPLAGVATNFFNTNYMIVEASGPLPRATTGGGFNTLVHTNGEISEQARLHGSQLAGVMSPTAIWTVASVLFVPKHLRDISRQMANISAVISKISQFQQNERLSGIIGDYTYLVDIVEMLESSPEAMDEMRLGVIEDVYRKTNSSYVHFLTDIQNVNIDPKDMESAFASVAELNQLVAQLFLVFQVRIQCFKLQEMFNPNTFTIAKRLDRFWEDVSKIPLIIYKKFDDFFDQEISFWDSLEKRKQAIQEIEESSKKFEKMFDGLAKAFNDMSHATSSMSGQKQKLLLKMDGDRIVGISDCD